MRAISIYELSEPDRERVFAWARYVFWADVECTQYESYEALPDEPVTGLSFVLMAQWYASLWVAIESWQGCPLSDPTIDELLDDSAFQPWLNLLRRFRNGVYHYQESLTDERLGGFLREAANTVPWAFLVHSEFKRLIWEIAHPRTVPVACQDEIAEHVRHVIGWLPENIIEAAPLEAARHYQEAVKLIRGDAGAQAPEEADELLASVDRLRLTAMQSATDWATYKRAMIDLLKLRTQC